MSNFRLEDEFIARTEANLRAIDELSKQGANVYEVTQLINSLLGLLIFPKERMFYKIPHIRREDMEREGWPLPYEEKSQVRNLRELVKSIRNAVAHFNIELTHDENEIVGIRFENYSLDDEDKKEPIWVGKFELDSLRRFVYMLLARIRKSQSPR